jgi:hypothetical protein
MKKPLYYSRKVLSAGTYNQSERKIIAKNGGLTKYLSHMQEYEYLVNNGTYCSQKIRHNPKS